MDHSVWVLVPLFGIFFPMLAAVVIVWAVARHKQVQAKYRAEVQARVVDKFATAPEFVDFLATPAGREFVQNFRIAPESSAHDRIFSGIKWSLLLGVFGLAFLVARAMGEESDLIIPGLIFFGLGVALMISTIISYRLSKQWGLIKPVEPSNASGVTTP